MSTIQKLKHWPNLNTVIMVEDTLKKMEGSVVSVADLKRKLPRQINHNTLKIILKYLEKSNKILVTISGITWIFNPSAKLRKAILEGFEI